MALPALAGAVVRKFGGRVLRRGAALARGAVGRAVGRRLGVAARGRGRRRGVPSLSASEMGKLMFMKQVLGSRSPAMTLMVMKALRGRF